MATVNLRPGQVAESPAAPGSIDAIYKISLSVSLSVGDIHLIGKIPHGAIPVGAVFYPGPALAGTAVAKFGTSASQELFFASATYSQAVATSTRKLGVQMQISVSDESVVRYDNVTMVGTAGISVGYVGDLVVRYRMPGQAL